ncbi:MAG: site-2 protease family protein [Candidatus Omnitrophota bacterium]
MLTETIGIIVAALIVFLAVILHEFAHGWVAYKLGDPTAKRAGRLTLNPIKHIDPIGTILLPAFLIFLRSKGINTFVFGWAKPIPVNFMNLRHPKGDMLLVGIAGPLINVLLALSFSFFLRMEFNRAVYDLIVFSIFVNLLLAIFNLIPIPPLDGSRLVMGLLPGRYAVLYSRLEPYGIAIVAFLLYFGFYEKIVLPLVFLSGRALGVIF